MERRLVSGPDKNGIKITEVRSITFNNDLNKFLEELDSYLIIDCNGQNTINDIKQYPSFYNFFIVSDENFPLLSSFCLKQHLNNQNLFELWAVCRHRKTARSIDKKYKNITMNSIKVVLDLMLNRNRNHVIWLEVTINSDIRKIEEAVKLIDYYSDIGFINESIKNPNEVSPTGIQISSYHQTMILDNNSININKGQKKRNKSEFLWDCYCLFKEKVSFYISKELVGILKNKYITKDKEYGFGFYINQKQEIRKNIYKLSLVRESKTDVTYMSDDEEDQFEWSKKCTLPEAKVTAFSYMHTHPVACYETPNKKYLEINPPSAADVSSMIFFNWRFILVPCVEGLHFLKTTNIFNNNYKTLGPNEKNKEVESIKQKFVNDLQTILLRDIENGYFVRPNLDPTRLTRFITLYGETLTKLFPGVFIYKFFPWTDSDIYLYKNEIIT